MLFIDDRDDEIELTDPAARVDGRHPHRVEEEVEARGREGEAGGGDDFGGVNGCASRPPGHDASGSKRCGLVSQLIGRPGATT